MRLLRLQIFRESTLLQQILQHIARSSDTCGGEYHCPVKSIKASRGKGDKKYQIRHICQGFSVRLNLKQDYF